MLQARSGLLTMIGEDVPTRRIADVLYGQVGRIVIDRTEMAGKFDYKLEWVQDAANMPSINGAKMEASVRRTIDFYRGPGAAGAEIGIDQGAGGNFSD